MRMLILPQLCFRCSQNDWAPGPCEGILLSSSSDMGRNIHIIRNKLWSSGNIPSPVLVESRDKHNGVFSFTFTRALCKNVKRKLRSLNVQISGLDGSENVARRESFAFSKHISEVCLNFEPCDIVLYMPALMSVMSVFISPDSPTVHSKKSQNRCPGASKDKPWLVSSSSLPLTYINLSQLRLYIPGDDNDCSKNGENNGDSVTVNSSQDTGISDNVSHRGKCVRNTTEDDMCVVLLQTLAVHPQADNPLQRMAIDKGLYHQALHAGITQLPGSAIEDRQYQIDVKGLTLCTGI